jgi:hypothetical protein
VAEDKENMEEARENLLINDMLQKAGGRGIRPVSRKKLGKNLSARRFVKLVKMASKDENCPQ